MSSTSVTVRCVAGILRRMLCSRSLPTHPTDHITESSSSSITASEELEKSENKVASSVVAKLMGLDSVPNAITRSRSMNSIDHELNGEHRRLNGTLSFREMPMPTFFELENEEFFELSFENESEKKHKRLKERKCEKGIGELKQRSEETCVRLESLEFSTTKNHGEELRKKKKKVKNVELECSSEESSPVSVLAFDQFIIEHEVPTSDSLGSNSRRKLSQEPENYESQLKRRNDNNLMILDDLKIKKVEGSKQIYLKICKMVEDEILESNWLCSRNTLKHEDFEGIYADFESQILDQLLHELVIHQLIGLLL